jgi:hypothetical protein
MAYQDGNFTNAIQDGPARIFYPFINAATKDNVTKGTVRNYVVVPSSYTPAAALSTDPADNTQYLLNESELSVEGGLGRFSRTYCKVPTDQVDYSSIVITKPAFPSNDYAGAWVDSTSSNATANIFSAAIAATMSWYPTGGTFTITFGANTTAALNTTDSNATIAAAINGLASVITASFTVTVTNSLTTAGTLQLIKASGVGSFGPTDFTMNAGSMTPAVNVGYSGITNSEIISAIRSSPNANKTSHGLSNAAVIRISSTTGGGNQTIVNSIVDNNNFTFAWTATGIGFSNYRTFLRTYTPGTDRVLTKQTDKFYLPTVTPGITTAADIPVPDVAINDTQLLDLIAASASGFQNYDAEPVTGWPSDQSPVYRQRFIQINVDDL